MGDSYVTARCLDRRQGVGGNRKGPLLLPVVHFLAWSLALHRPSWMVLPPIAVISSCLSVLVNLAGMTMRFNSGMRQGLCGLEPGLGS
jgi:hypothetical protein